MFGIDDQLGGGEILFQPVGSQYLTKMIEQKRGADGDIDDDQYDGDGDSFGRHRPHSK